MTRFVRRVVRFARLDGLRRSLFFRAVALLWKHRIGLWTGPFRVPDSPLGPPSPRTGAPAAPGSVASPPDRRPSPGVIGWAVTAASRFVPRSTCLVRALAAQSLCRRYGYPCRLQLGARRGEAGDLEAHAWLEIGDEVVIGGGEVLGEYTPFSPARRQGEGEPAS
jgi:hypothetical protein